MKDYVKLLEVLKLAALNIGSFLLNKLNHPMKENDKFINKVIKLLKCESQHRSFLQKQHLSSILSEIETLDLQNSNETMKSRKNILRKQLNDYYQEKLKGLEIRNKFVLKNFCQLPSKILLKETDKNNIKTTIDEIYFENEPIIDQDKIIQFHNHYNVMIGKTSASQF